MSAYVETARLVDATTVRAVLAALRGDLDRFQPPATPDQGLVEPVERPFESVADAADRLAELEVRLQERSDRRAVFLTVYVRMTREVHAGIAAGRFADPEWMRAYLVTFANYYRRAFLAFERGDLAAVPDPWRVAFGTAVAGDALVVQDALLGVNAHVNYDLALALDDVGIDPNRPAKYADHRAVDDVLARLVDAQQAALAERYAAGVDDLDGIFGEFDEMATRRSLTAGREQAWRIAVIRTDVGLAPVRRFARWLLRTTATGSAHVLLGSQLDPTLERTLRHVEREGLALDEVLDHVRERLEDTR